MSYKTNFDYSATYWYRCNSASESPTPEKRSRTKAAASTLLLSPRQPQTHELPLSISDESAWTTAEPVSLSYKEGQLLASPHGQRPSQFLCPTRRSSHWPVRKDNGRASSFVLQGGAVTGQSARTTAEPVPCPTRRGSYWPHQSFSYK